MGQPSATSPFRAWEIRDSHEAGTDTTMVNLSDGSLVLTWRDPIGEVHTYRGSFGLAARSTESAPVYVGGKLSKSGFQGLSCSGSPFSMP
jgi:hypothetical protein